MHSIQTPSEFLVGPFTQLMTLSGLPPAGPISDHEIHLIKNGGLHIREGKIVEAAPFDSMRSLNIPLIQIDFPSVALPGFIDAHTHLCYAGSRAADYALRLQGHSYHEIAAMGGGILETVRKTRATSQQELVELMLPRLARQLQIGITTCEVKSGYGLDVDHELKMLAAIKEAGARQPISLISTCLAAHACPSGFASRQDYLNHLIEHLLPRLKPYTQRIDIFIDEGGFSAHEAKPFLRKAHEQGFSPVIHANQFTSGGAHLAAQLGALSADHLERCTAKEANALKKAGVIPIVLPGASLGLGMPFAPARRLLDAHLPLVIASDWNPGSAPMGNLLTEAAVLGAAQQLTMAETLAAMTTRAAKALDLHDRGELKKGMRADFIVFPSADYKEILYNQGSLNPSLVFIEGKLQKEKNHAAITSVNSH